MTYLTSTYNFMDLLKDNGVVPAAPQQTSALWARVTALFSQVETPEFDLDYDFMDLMHSKGFVPAHCNDNDLWADAA